MLHDGGVLANIPQTTLMDAAGCAFAGSVPGDTAAGTAVHLWSYGVIPASQPKWAAWLHLMASARGDSTLAAAVADSGVRLPWQGRPAVAGLYSYASRMDIWDATTGEHLAGPWYEEIPEEHHGDLSWPPASESEEDMSGEGLPVPETFEDLEDAKSDEESAHELLLDSPVLPLGTQVILAGSGGLFAIEPTAGESFSGLNSPNVKPFSGRYAFPTAVTPLDSPPPGRQTWSRCTEPITSTPSRHTRCPTG